MLAPMASWAQCAYSANPFGSGAAPVVIGGVTTMTTCNYYGELSPVTGFLSSNVYSINVSGGGFITIFDGTNTAVAFGAAPLSFIPPVNGNYQTQYNSAVGCGTDASCHTTTTTLVGPSSACTGPAVAGTTVSSPTSACSGVAINLSLSGASTGSGLTYQWESSTDGITYAPIGGATNATYSTIQAANTYYHCIVICSAGAPSTSAPVTVNMNPFFNCYCVPTNAGTSCITNVTLDALNNTTAGCSVGNVSAQPGTTLLAIGATYTVSISTNASAITSVWIDFNQNGIYEATEWVQPYTTGLTGSASITIPGTAVSGTTGMRVRSRGAGNINNATSACIAMGGGETEDYIVTISPPPTCPGPTALTNIIATTTTANVSWTAGGGETEWEVAWGTPGFTVNGAGELGSMNALVLPTALITGLTPGSFYQAKVRAICTPGDTSFVSNTITFNTYGLGQYIDVNQNCLTFASIVDSAATVNLGMTDDSSVGYTLPFSFYYQGALISNIGITNNGGVAFNTLVGPAGYSMGVTGVYPFQQDLATPTLGEGQYRLVTGTAPNRKFIVEWNVQHYFSSPSAVRFQLVMEETTGEFYFLYDDVDFGNPIYNNGLDAEIGIRGTQNINLSINSTAYLTANTCAHFFYTNCPKPSAPIVSSLTSTDFNLVWTAGITNETDWVVEYGLNGFTPGTGTFINTVSPNTTITGLTQLTDYDVYIYANCVGVPDTSTGLLVNVLTLPYCNYPVLTSVNDRPDSLLVNWTWTQTVAGITGFNTAYVNSGDNVYTGSIFPGDEFVNDTIVDAALMAGGVYDVYVQAICGTDSSLFVGPITVVMPLTNDSVCTAEVLLLDDVTRTFNNVGATTALNEVGLVVPVTNYNDNAGWGSVANFNKTTWFQFVAPASGSVRINTTGSSISNKVAVWAFTNCGDFATATLAAANDDDEDFTSTGNTPSNFVACGLTPGATYYIQHSNQSAFSASGNYKFRLRAVAPNAGNALALTSICYGDSIDLYTRLTGIDSTYANGTWSDNFNTGHIYNGTFGSPGLASTTFTFTYTLREGCATDTTNVQVTVVNPPSAGIDGAITACRNEPINLYTGLSGLVDLGGTFKDPANATVPSSDIWTANFVGQYNYTYIVTNGVCPNDTSNVVVTVTACNWLSLDEQTLTGFTFSPNPTDGIVNVTNSSSDVFSYEITDAKGSLISTGKNAIASKAVINLSANEPGVYMIRVFNANTEKVIRVVKM